MLGGQKDGQGICAHHVHEVFGGFFPEDLTRGDSCIGEEDVKAAIRIQCVLADLLDSGLVGGVKLTRMYLCGGIQCVEFTLVLFKMRVGEVAEVDCASTVACELMCTGAADTNFRVCS